MAENGSRSEREQTLAALRQSDKFVVVTHENPDGDALGSLIAMQEVLQTLGKDALMFIDEFEFPLPQEYRFLPLHGHVSSPPDDLAERTLVFLDCGNVERNRAAEVLQYPNARILNIDHHHDNTRFGTVNLVDSHSSCTAEIVWDLMRGLRVAPSQTVAEALYVGLITDTGRFMYENTGPRAHIMAAELIDAGVDVHEMYRRVYEGVPFGKLALLARGLTNIQRFDGGQLTLTALSAQDFAESGAEESYSEGVVDHLRAVEGTLVAALVRERLCPNGSPTTHKVSLRSSDGRVDVSAIAREVGGGGHRQAAGFTTEMDSEQIVEFLRGAVAEQLAAA